MRQNIYTSEEIEKALNFLTPLFENDNLLFKSFIKKNLAYLEGKNFTYIIDKTAQKTYKIMGNCTGPIIYVRDILNIDS